MPGPPTEQVSRVRQAFLAQPRAGALSACHDAFGAAVLVPTVGVLAGAPIDDRPAAAKGGTARCGGQAAMRNRRIRRRAARGRQP